MNESYNFNNNTENNDKQDILKVQAAIRGIEESIATLKEDLPRPIYDRKGKSTKAELIEKIERLEYTLAELKTIRDNLHIIEKGINSDPTIKDAIDNPEILERYQKPPTSDPEL